MVYMVVIVWFGFSLSFAMYKLDLYSLIYSFNVSDVIFIVCPVS